MAFLLCVVPWKKIAQRSIHQIPVDGASADTDSDTADQSGGQKANVPAGNLEQPPATGNSPEVQAEPSTAGPTSSSAVAQQPVTAVSDEYPYYIAEDRKSFDSTAIDITVGDRLYMTQINDWYLNFKNYADKTVEIEGYFLDMGGKYTFVGRNGPTCPYCTGGYVDFEFQTDQDLSGFVSQETWIAVTGILREGTINLSNGDTKPFYYIEAIDVSKMDQAGVNPISD